MLQYRAQFNTMKVDPSRVPFHEYITSVSELYTRGTSDGSTFMVMNLREILYEFLLYKSNFLRDYFFAQKIPTGARLRDIGGKLLRWSRSNNL